HSFRHTFGTMLAASGVHPKTAQDLMRHSDINLTMSRYTHTLRGQAAAAVASLPNFSIVEVAEADKTGTV
ncbi:MAG TPA: tyrosine-type recombinase/integrase, partial [Sedimentisphaerales bacterium]|nr:tyrosine-type recombinase/integrase [Sedimentisphaerales bacterium]